MGLLPGSDSGQERLKIEAYETIDCTGSPVSTFTAQTNPEELSYSFKIDNGGGGEDGATEGMTGNAAVGNSAAPPVFRGYFETTLEFKIYADATGIVPVPDDMKDNFGSDTAPTIKPYLDLLQNTVYSYQEGSHGPPYLKLIWGKVFPSSSTKLEETQPAVYKGQLESYDVKVTLFSIKGEPIKAEINLKIKSLIAPDAKPLGQSPDLTHHIPITFGDKMTMHCNKIYGRYDAKICAAVAEYNGMIDWNLQSMAGKTLTFPSIHLLNEKYLDAYKDVEPKEIKAFNKKSEYEQMVSLVGEKKAKQYLKTFGTA